MASEGNQMEGWKAMDFQRMEIFLQVEPRAKG